VTRTKSRWKCSLKDGIMHINNKDILFNKVSFPLMIDGNSVTLSVFILYWTLVQSFHWNASNPLQATGEFDF
jgi:hypothetical protein